jgi:Tfp pilus assembly protein PilN
MKDYLNLIPWKCRKAQLLRLRLRQWCLPWAIAGGLVLAAGVVKWDQWRCGRDRVERLQRACGPTDSLLAEIQALTKRVEALKAREAAVAQLEDPRPALALLGLVSRSAKQCEGRLRVELLSLQTKQDAGASAGLGPTAAGLARRKSLVLKGIAADNLAVAQFVLALRQTKAFDRVELKSSQVQPADHRPARTYQVECLY